MKRKIAAVSLALLAGIWFFGTAAAHPTVKMSIY